MDPRRPTVELMTMYEPLPAANSIPEPLAAGTTLGDLICALQDAADEATDDREEADMLVCAALVELRHRVVSARDSDAAQAA